MWYFIYANQTVFGSPMDEVLFHNVYDDNNGTEIKQCHPRLCEPCHCLVDIYGIHV